MIKINLYGSMVRKQVGNRVNAVHWNIPRRKRLSTVTLLAVANGMGLFPAVETQALVRYSYH